MRRYVRWAAAALLILAAAGTAVAVAGTAAVGDPPPGWETDAAALGGIAFYDANGSPVIGGTLEDPPVAFYAVADGPGRNGDNKAQLKAFTPQVGVNPGLWSGDILTGSTNYPAAGAPANIAAMTNPVATGTRTDFSFADYLGEFPNGSTTAGYAGLY